MLDLFAKKEAPIQGMMGMSGGVPSKLLTLASGEPTYIEDVFSTYLYKGNSTARSINNGIDLAGKGGLVWTKSRTSAHRNCFLDTERGVHNVLFSDTTVGTDTDNTTITSFNSNGYTMGASAYKLNVNNQSICSWTFRKAPGFFDVVTYTGDGNSSGQTINHNLGSVPGMIIVKRYDGGSEQWNVYHRSMGNNALIYLSATDGKFQPNTNWNNTTPTSTTFTVRNSSVNHSGGSFVAYLFAHNDGSFGEDSDEAVIKCGSYTGTQSEDTEINVGFEPQFLLIKNTSSNSTDWVVVDSMRGLPVGSDSEVLKANSSGTPASYRVAALTPTGFKLGQAVASINGSGDTYIYMAIRRPHKTPEAATDVFAIDTKSAKSANTPSYTTNFPVDFALRRNDITSINSASVFTRLTATERLLTDSKAAASTVASFDDHFMFNNGYGDFTSGDSNDYGYFFKRAPGFMDVVAYTGNGVQGRNISHNLEVAPELMIVKNRDTTNDDWMVYVSGVTYQSVHGNDPDSYGNNPPTLKLQSTDAANFSMSGTWDHTHPTATTFRVGDTGSTNGNNEDLIALLFASLDGISKIGTYTGTANAINVDCGFTNGAKFVLIKRVDSSTGGHWYVFDTSQGINSGSDPFFRLNVTNAQGSADLIDPYNAGFSVASGTTNVNYSGGTYLFLAIA